MNHHVEDNRRESEEKLVLAAREFVINVELFRAVIARKLNMALSDVECLGILYHKEVTTPSELVEHTGLSSGATTAMLIRLEKAGLIKRSADLKDRRRVHIELVEEEQERIRNLFAPVNHAERALIANYSDSELKLLLSFINNLATTWGGKRKDLERV